MSISSPLKWHGGKFYLAAKLWQIAKSIPHIHRVEVYVGSGALTLASDPEGYSEVINDANGELMNFWWVLAEEHQFQKLIRRLQVTPFSEQAWKDSRKKHDPLRDPVVRAAEFFVRCRQSLAGRMDTFAPLSRTRVRRGMNEQASAWLSAIEGLPEVHDRLKRVAGLNRDALEVIRTQDGPDTLFYLDPPYLPSTRKTVGEYGAHEMTPEQHEKLLQVLAGVAGKFLLSGYRSDMYDTAAQANGWERHDFELPNNSASGKAKRRMVECVWVKR